MGVGVAQAALQGVMLQGVRVLPYLDLAARAQQGQVAQDGGVVPAVAFAFKALQQAFDGGTRAALCIGVDEGQHLLFRLGDVGVVVDQQAVFHHAQVFADVGLVVGHVAQHAQVGVGALNQVFKAFEDAGLAVFAADGHVGRVDDERGLAQQLAGAHLQFVKAFGVLKALGVQDAFDGFLLGVAVLADVFFGALVHDQVLHEARIGGQDHAQLVAPHALHALQGQKALAAVKVVGQRCGDVDGQFVLAAERAVVHLAGVGVVLAVAVADLALADGAVEQQGLQLFEQVGVFNLGGLDFFFDVFFFVGQVLVGVAVALDVGLLLQQVECGFKLLALGGQVLGKAIEHEHAEVTQRGLEFLDVLDQEKRLENAHGVGVAQVAFGVVDGALDGAFECTTNAFEHAVERGQLADGFVLDGDGHVAKHAQHGTFAHRVGLAFKAVVLRQPAYGGLEQRKLVRHEGVAVNEMLYIAVVLVLRAAIGKVEQGFEVVGLLLPGLDEQVGADLVFGEQALLDDFSYVGAGEFEAVGKAGLDF